MVHIATAEVIDRAWISTTLTGRTVADQYSVLIVRDPDANNDFLDAVCEFLDIGVTHATPADDLPTMLATMRPMAVIADLDGEVQDGYHVMKMAAHYDRALPVLLLTCNDAALLGAADAIQEIWGLTRVSTATPEAGIGTLVDFICHAARDAGRSRLMRV